MLDLPNRSRNQSGALPLWLAAGLYNGRRLLRGLRFWGHDSLAAKPSSLQCQPLLMVSSGRSGTTLLRSMLVGGGQIAIPPETHVLPYTALQFKAMGDLSWDNRVRLMIGLFESPSTFAAWETDLQPVYARLRGLPRSQRTLAHIIEAVYLHYRDLYFPDAITWGDQSPNNAPYIDWVRQIFPQGRYVHVLRDGRDVVASYVEKGHGLEEAVERWRVSVHQADKLKKRLPAEQFLRLRYEDLVTEPEPTLRAVCDFAGIDFSTEMLNYWQKSTTVEHKYYGKPHENLAKPVFSSSIGRWKERLTDDQQRTVSQGVNDLLHQTGYLES